ncbi:hypothetical protein [Kitasatospora sp. NPDC088548]|uniref:hypothetical protein n=1 Tax=Kitasatospora sp. NPDC088548 TaxID=3364075 RepID=UPI0037F1ADC9
MSSKPSKTLRIVLATAIATSGAVVATTFTTASAQAAVTSTNAVQLTRSEVLSRANSWVDKGLKYNQQGSYQGYRTDCSGYASMAWKLSTPGLDTTSFVPSGVASRIGKDALKPGDALLNDAAGNNGHIVIFDHWVDSSHASYVGYEFSGSGVWHRTIPYPYFAGHGTYFPVHDNGVVDSPTAPGLNDNPAALPPGTLVKAPGGSTVKVIVDGAGLAITGSDVAADGYDLSKIVNVTDASFNALAGAPSAGTVVYDQAGNDPSRYVTVGGTALPISAAEWTAYGYNTRPLMGVPTSWLQGALANPVASGTVVMDQSGTDSSRYVMLGGAALPIGGAEWTANGYDVRPLMGVPGQWLRGAVQRSVPDDTVVMDQAGTDSSRYVIQNGVALPIGGAEWTANGYDIRPLMGVPGQWLAGRAGAVIPNRTIVRDAAGGNSTIYVTAGGVAVPLSGADYTAFGYDQLPLRGVPGAWLSQAAAKAAPVNGTLLVSPDSTTVWLVTGGAKKGLTAADFGPGKYSLDDVVRVPTALTAKLPTVQ